MLGYRTTFPCWVSMCYKSFFMQRNNLKRSGESPVSGLGCVLAARTPLSGCPAPLLLLMTPNKRQRTLTQIPCY